MWSHIFGRLPVPFHQVGDPVRDQGAEAFVAVHAAALLAGRTRQAIADLAAAAAEAGITDESSGVRVAVGYLTNKTEYLGYDIALASGWPVATGTVEGACRHLIADRLDIPGAKWGLPGAEAVLTLRALMDNDDFEDH